MARTVLLELLEALDILLQHAVTSLEVVKALLLGREALLDDGELLVVMNEFLVLLVCLCK